MAERKKDGTFEKGASGNPGGRPKLITEFRKALESRHYEKALTALEEALDDDDGKVRIAAAREVFDRMFGKATQPLSDANGKPLGSPIAALLEKLAK